MSLKYNITSQQKSAAIKFLSYNGQSNFVHGLKGKVSLKLCFVWFIPKVQNMIL
jgi:hypothetical protein